MHKLGTCLSRQISAGKPDSRWICQKIPRVKPPVNKGESPEIDLGRPIKGGHVSRDLPFREIGSRELGSAGNERSGCSMMETPK
jgi:hypothetical protein